jgi:hypothetical protein
LKDSDQDLAKLVQERMDHKPQTQIAINTYLHTYETTKEVLKFKE